VKKSNFNAHLRSLFFGAKLHGLSRFFSVQNCTDYLAFFPCKTARIIPLFFGAEINVYERKNENGK